MSTSLLRLEGIVKHFWCIQALQGISLSITPHSLYGLIGPNGAGKTTLFNIITGFYQADLGEMFLAGTPLPSRIAPHEFNRRGIARTFQNIRLFPQMSVLDNVLVGRFRHRGSSILDSVLRTRRFREDEQRQRGVARDLLQLMGLEGRERNVAATLAYGEQRRLEIARALATEPQLLALDEPAAGMNGRETEELGQRLQSLQKNGLTLMVVEHDLPWVLRLCDRIAVLDFGHLVVDDVPAVVQRHPQVIAAYLGGED